MLKGLDPLLLPELLQALAAMGHGDEIAVVDANFPASACARRLVQLAGVPAPRALSAVLSVLPLDTVGGPPLATMAVVDDPAAVPDVVREFRALADAAEGRALACTALAREDFYARARAAYAVVQTGEARLYANVLLRKGVVPP